MNSLNREFATKSDLRAEIVEMKVELKQEIAEMKAELKADIANLRTELREINIKLGKIEKTLESRVDSLKFTIIKWMSALTVVLLTLTLSGVGLMIKFIH